jgi:hypothetical protein
MAAQPEYHQKVDEDSPDRCQGVMQGVGQCRNIKAPGSQFCLRHGGNKAAEANRKEGTRTYMLQKWRERVNTFADSSNIKSLREEIGIVRMMLEMFLNRFKDEEDLLMHFEKVTSLIDKIEKLVVSCQKLEEKTGSMIDKTTLLVICDFLVGIVGEHVLDPDALNLIGEKFMDAIAKTVTIGPT